jgi:Glycosyl hydrolases family 16
MKSTGWKEEDTVPLNDTGAGGGSGRTRRSNNSISFAPNVATAATATGRSTSSSSYSQEYDYSSGGDGDDDDDYDDDDEGDEYFLKVDDDEDAMMMREKEARKEMKRADRLSVRLLAIDDDDEETESAILVDALGLDEDEEVPRRGGGSPAQQQQPYKRRGSRLNLHQQQQHSGSIMGLSLRNTTRFRNMLDFYVEESQKNAARKVCFMISLAVIFVLVFFLCWYIGIVQRIVGRPPNQPVGPYALVERQEGLDFFQYYTFYVGRDSVGSNGYNMYIDRTSAEYAGICNVTYEDDVLDVYNNNINKAVANLSEEEEEDEMLDSVTSTKIVQQRPRGQRQRQQRSLQEQEKTATNASTAKYATAEQVDNEKKKATAATAANMTPPTTATTMTGAQNVDKSRSSSSTRSSKSNMSEPFVYLGSSPTLAGPRDSIRLEGIRRFNRGLFIIDVRHLPAGCGVWPAFWLTDEANWPVNGEIDIVEGVNYQDMAKTAMHSTKGCAMDDIPLGTMTGTWDTAQGIPDKKTGVPDMTLRYVSL